MYTSIHSLTAAAMAHRVGASIPTLGRALGEAKLNAAVAIWPETGQGFLGFQNNKLPAVRYFQ